jgi:UDP-N-acetylmuramate--alanine ligase
MHELTQNDLKLLIRMHARRIHLLGIYGSGMSALARLLAQSGHKVTGSDSAAKKAPEWFGKLGIIIHAGHRAENVGKAEVIVYSSAIAGNNPEIQEAQKRGIPIVKRARMLAALMDGKKSIVVSGSHGKTTTTAMISHVLSRAGLEPSFYVGAHVGILGSGAELGKGDYFVIESDESDGSIAEFNPEILVMLNVEREHLDYYPDLDAIKKVFREIALRARRRVFFCKDDPGAVSVCKTVKTAKGWSLKDAPKDLKLGIPGMHNISNACAVLAVTDEIGIGRAKVFEALGEFTGAKRRFDKLYTGDVTLVDDYAHHPSEIKATLQTARAEAKGRLLAVFQPHRFTRTKHLCEDFGKAFRGADKVFITDIYAASESPIAGVDGKMVADAVARGSKTEVVYEPELWKLRDVVGREIQDGDFVLVMGAGNIAQVSRSLAEDLKIAGELRKKVGAKTVIKRYEPMSKRTTMRVGGCARLWVEPANDEDVLAVVQYARKEKIPLTVVGRGSNLLVLDAGISGITLHPAGEHFERMVFKDDGSVEAGSGVRLKKLVMAARGKERTGLEFMEGIPGDVGGGLRMNAGAMGNSVFDVIDSVRYIDKRGKLHDAKPSQMGVSYRHCDALEGGIALSAVFKTAAGTRAQIDEKLKMFERKRWDSQPAKPSSGCIFKNTASIPAGKLIDELKLKGLRFGDAVVSDVHGNFIINAGGATAHDVLQLIELIKDRVRQARGIELETEVVILGDEKFVPTSS